MVFGLSMFLEWKPPGTQHVIDLTASQQDLILLLLKLHPQDKVIGENILSGTHKHKYSMTNYRTTKLGQSKTIDIQNSDYFGMTLLDR